MKKSANLPSGLVLGEAGTVTTQDHVEGPADAPVTIIEYSDFQCPACQYYYTFVEKLTAEASTTVRVIYRHFPLPQHANAMPAAIASEAASAQGKFWEMYDLLFTNAAEWVDLSDASPIFLKYAETIDLDTARFTVDLASSTIRERVISDKNGGIKIGLNATPTFFINGKAIENPQNYEQFKALVDTAAITGTK